MALEFFTGAVVSSLSQDFIDKIKMSTYDQICHAFSDVEQKLKTLEHSYARAQSLLDNINGWELVTSKPHREWVGDAMRACYDMEDLTADVMDELKKTGNALSFLKNWVLSREINELQSNLDQVLAEASDFVTPDRRSTLPTTNIVTTEPMPVPVNLKTFQRKREMNEIIDMLLSTTSSIIISIEGMFGLGKTTLAKVVKSNPRIQHHFDQIFWVPVSGDFDFLKVISSIVIQAQKPERIDELPLTRMIQELCKGRRVLIVLDDVHRITKLQDWEEFQSLLDSGSTFSVLITTRNPKVSRNIASLGNIPVIPLHLQLMSDEDCSSFLLGRTLSMRIDNTAKRRRCTSEKTALGIAQKLCKGIPLVADIIRLHLACETEDRWSSMSPRNLWDIPAFKEQIFPAFRLDYSDLPIALKSCFRYLSLFPSNFKYNKEDLVQLWMAEGFIVPSQPRVAGEPQHRSLEDIGYEYFDELMSRSILQIYHPFEHESEPQIFKMHYFIHHYSEYVSSDIYLLLDKKIVDAHSSVNKGMPLSTANSTTWYQKARHMSLLCPIIRPSILKDLEKYKALRTLISVHQHTRIEPLSYKLFLNLQTLRVLSLSSTDIRKLPESIGKLKHLQLLDVSKTDIKDLPVSTAQLHRLKVLKLKDCPELLRLPKDTKNLTDLLHLEVDANSLSCMPPKIGKLRNLQTLPVFIVGDEDGYLITELKNMKHLRGSICLKNLENVSAYEEAMEARLNTKLSLRKLMLEWGNSSVDQSVAEEVLNGLEPHENLEELQVIGYDGLQFPSWLSSPECGLKRIHLQECHICSMLPPLGQLQNLRNLHIQEMHGVKYVDHQFPGRGANSGFPVLVSLTFQDMVKLERWEGLQATHMPQLRELMIMDCPLLIALPSLYQLTSLKNLEISNCPVLQSLPEEGLPSSLVSLIIGGSDPLQQRCQPEQGADWDKIKTIPQVVIDFVQIRTLTTR